MEGGKTVTKTEYTIEPGKQDIISTVVLDAARELVFRAYTDPKLFAQWWGPRRYENEIDKFDARSGGEWRGGHPGAAGTTPAARSAHPTLEAAERLTPTFPDEPHSRHVAPHTTPSP